MIKKSTGFTLIELMVTIAVLAIIAGIGIPSMSGFIEQNKVNSIKEQLASAINLARSEAIQKNEYVVICGIKKNEKQCKTGGNKKWHFGWLVFVDKNNNSLLDTDETIINQKKIEDQNTKIQLATAMKAISYHTNGMAWSKKGANSILLSKNTISICKGNAQTALSIEKIGSPTSAKDQATCPEN